MFNQLTRLAALISSFALISLGHSALSSLLLQQGARYSFSDSFLGILVSVSYVGFFAGVYMMRYLLRRVSYIRTFSVCAAVMSVWSLSLPIVPTETWWILSRLFHGLFFSTTIIICDGWLNSTVSNESRSRIYSIYMTASYIAYGLSQYILILGDTLSAAAFSVAAAFIILSLLPVCLTRVPEPQFSASTEEKNTLSVTDTYRIAPVAYVGQFAVGLSQGAAWLFVRYAEGVSDSVIAASNLAVIFFISGFIMQFPVGWWSDRAKDRRTVMACVYGVSTVFSGLLFFGEYFPFGILAFLVFLYGAISVTAFPLNSAYGQDFAGRERSSEYSSRLFQSYAAGALLGPVIVGELMETLSLAWLFGFCFFVFSGITAFVLTNRFMPRFRPAKTEPFQVLSSHLPIGSMETPEFNELAVGPDMPVAAGEDIAGAPEMAVGPVFVGTDANIDAPVGPLPDENIQPTVGQDVGPTPPPAMGEKNGD